MDEAGKRSKDLTRARRRVRNRNWPAGRPGHHRRVGSTPVGNRREAAEAVADRRPTRLGTLADVWPGART
jgi:hypothetical protein